ncbi:MAG: ABC transporter substrate-binding protein [Gemmatimonadota bacterium]
MTGGWRRQAAPRWQNLRRRAALGTVLAAATAGCGDRARLPPAASSDGTPEERGGGTAVVAGREPIATLNPLTSTDYVARQVENHLLLMTLVRYDSTFTERPYLATAWEVSEDGRQILFRLRPDIRWHDGVPTTARDVAFTFLRAKDDRVPFPNRAYFDRWKSVEVVDDTTVRFSVEPGPGLLFGWTETAILPEHLLGNVPPERLAADPFGTSRPVGNGPFRFAGRQGPDTWIFEANLEFPAELGGAPRLDRLVYRVIPDETTLLSELLTGRVQLYLDLPPSQVGRVRESAATLVATYPSPAVTFIAWNTRRPQLAEPAVRRALTLAIDREQLVNAARNGLGVVATGPVGPWHWAHDPKWRPLPYAADSARGVLERAGWRDGDGDGVREKQGVELRVELMTNENPVRREIAVIVQDQLRRAGVAVRPLMRESASMGAAVTSPERPFDAAILAFVQDRILDDRDQWRCAGRDRPFHFSGYCDPALDAILDSIPRTTDRDVRRNLYRRYHEHIARAQPYTYLFYDIVAAGVRRELRGVRLDPRGELAGAPSWRLASPTARDR